MFDNEIDWVTQIGKPHVRREARRWQKFPRSVYIQGRAQAMDCCKSAIQASVQSKKSVFRSCSSNTRERS
jgi:hypothetical protein